MFYNSVLFNLQGRTKSLRVTASGRSYHVDCYKCEVTIFSSFTRVLPIQWAPWAKVVLGCDELYHLRLWLANRFLTTFTNCIIMVLVCLMTFTRYRLSTFIVFCDGSTCTSIIALATLHLKINSVCRIVAGSLLAKEVMRSATHWRAISTAGSVMQPGSTSGTNSAATISKNPD